MIWDLPAFSELDVLARHGYLAVMQTEPLRATRMAYLNLAEWESDLYTVPVQLSRETTSWEREGFLQLTTALPGGTASLETDRLVLTFTTVEEVRTKLPTIQVVLGEVERFGGDREARANAEMKRRNDLAREGF